MLLYSIRDEKSELFIGPFFVRHEIDAVRRCLSALQDEKSNLNQYPEDYSLYFLGEISETTGIFKSDVFVVSSFSAFLATLQQRKAV